jgi:hypothetical protein
MNKPRNAMQAVLDRAARAGAAEPSPPGPSATLAAHPNSKNYDRPSRRNTRLIGGHFRPEVARQLRMLAAEEDTTIQALLEEAIDLLLAKKAKNPLGSGQSAR